LLPALGSWLPLALALDIFPYFPSLPNSLFILMYFALLATRQHV